MNWRKFFKEHPLVKIWKTPRHSLDSGRGHVSTEKLYQAFKARYDWEKEQERREAENVVRPRVAGRRPKGDGNSHS